MPIRVGESLSLEDVIAVARGAEVELGPDATSRIEKARDVVERAVAANRTVYGVTTGFGSLANERIDPAQADALQEGIVRSHATAVGRPLSRGEARAMLLLRANRTVRTDAIRLARGVRLRRRIRLHDRWIARWLGRRGRNRGHPAADEQQRTERRRDRAATQAEPSGARCGGCRLGRRWRRHDRLVVPGHAYSLLSGRTLSGFASSSSLWECVENFVSGLSWTCQTWAVRYAHCLP